MLRRSFAVAFSMHALSAIAAEKNIHIVYMGGKDCPPCRAWRATELPKLQKMAAFQRVRFTYVEKLIKSPVPPSLFLPSEVVPYKDQLDTASNGIIGSPQTAVMVDGKVYDYFWGVRNASDFEGMIKAINEGKPYPFNRCVKRKSQSECAKTS
jgi:hypothetical protein